MARVCKYCGQEYTGFFCRCRKGKRGGRPRSVVSAGCGTRSWSVAGARARMLGGWGEGQDSRNEGIGEGVPRCLRCGTALEQVGEEWRCPACFERDAAVNAR